MLVKYSLNLHQSEYDIKYHKVESCMNAYAGDHVALVVDCLFLEKDIHFYLVLNCQLQVLKEY